MGDWWKQVNCDKYQKVKNRVGGWWNSWAPMLFQSLANRAIWRGLHGKREAEIQIKAFVYSMHWNIVLHNWTFNHRNSNSLIMYIYSMWWDHSKDQRQITTAKFTKNHPDKVLIATSLQIYFHECHRKNFGLYYCGSKEMLMKFDLHCNFQLRSISVIPIATQALGQPPSSQNYNLCYSILLKPMWITPQCRSILTKILKLRRLWTCFVQLTKYNINIQQHLYHCDANLRGRYTDYV